MRIVKSYFVEPNDKGGLIAEAFGITGGYQNKICDIDIPDIWDILYITGESGSGKSTIVREYAKNYSNETIPKETPLFLWGGSEELQIKKTLQELTAVGLSDAIMWLNYYENLSDSQKARAKIMLEMHHKQTIIVDEFLSTLDRSTAQSVAYCIQKAIRRSHKKAIFVTAHADLEKYLFPSFVITGESFPSRFIVSQTFRTPHNPFLEKIIYAYGNKEDYRNLRLGELHYKGKYTGGTKEYLFANLGDKTIGVLVSIYRMSDGGRRIARVVIHPSYRGIGIGVAIIKKYLSDYKNVDVVASMAMYNPVFEKAGMKRVDNSEILSPPSIKKELLNIGFQTDKWYDKTYCVKMCNDYRVRELVSKYSRFATHLICPGGNRPSKCDIKDKIIKDKTTAGRVLWGLRSRTMAKYISQ